MKKICIFILVLFSVKFIGCMSVNLNMFVDKTDPLQEFILSGENESEKILLLSIDGIITDYPGFKLIGESSNMVEEISAQLNKASKDPNIKAIFLKIDSPGGATTASDIIYNELSRFKEKQNVKIYAIMMDMATSGAYMVALPSDKIIAQPTTVTGSIGVVFMRPKIDGLMSKIGIEMHVSKSGENKDMGSPFRQDTPDEQKYFDEIVNKLNKHFYEIVLRHRKIEPDCLAKLQTARIFLAEEAMQLGLIDRIMYPNDALNFIKEDAKLSRDAALIVYRRKKYPNDNFYNRSEVKSLNDGVSLINLGPLEAIPAIKAGFYYIWPGTFAF